MGGATPPNLLRSLRPASAVQGSAEPRGVGSLRNGVNIGYPTQVIGMSCLLRAGRHDRALPGDAHLLALFRTVTLGQEYACRLARPHGVSASVSAPVKPARSRW